MAGFGHRLDNQFIHILYIALLHGRIRSLCGGRSHILQKLKHRGVHVKVDAQQADSHAAMIANYNGGRFKGFAFLVSVKVSDAVCVGPFLDFCQHGQSQVCDGEALASASIVTVYNFDYGMVQIVKAVQYDLVSIPKVSSQTIQHRFIRVQNSKISLGKHYIALFHRVSLPVSWIKSVFSIP